MKHMIQDIPYNGSLVEINDIDLVQEWEDWYKRKEEHPTDEIYYEGKLLYDKFRERYNITNCIRVGHLKDKPNQLAMTVSNIISDGTYYHPSNGTYSKSKLNK